MYKNIEWDSEYSPADINLIRTVEQNLGIVFPEEYRKLVQKYHGGKPSLKKIEINNKKVVFGYLLTFLAFDELDILDKFNSEKINLPHNCFPFAIDEDGNMFCFDYSNCTSPSIIFVEEIGSAYSVLFVAQSFRDFIKLLH
ncbi:MAG TPA: SMI1/KNR4 family protein [Chondromyces sp.]|nr:SMI1/KNR4 family protein [Chondromyces sp.]